MANFNDRELDELSSDACELTACQSFLSYFINYRNAQTVVNFATDTLENVLRNNLTSDKWVLLYIHNGNDVFSSKFCDALTNINVENILGDSSIFTVIAWNMSPDAECIRNALKKAITSSLSNTFSDYISSDKSVALLIDNSRKVFRLCDDEKKLASFINVLEDCQEVTHTYNGDNAFDLHEEINSTNFQQRMFDLLGDRDYDSFEPDQHDLLRCKIGYHLYGPPDVEPVGTANEDVSILRGTYRYQRARTINELFKKIIAENNKFCKWDGRVVINFIYVCVEPLAKEKQRRKVHNPNYNPKSDYTCIPLFVIRKCKGQPNNRPLCRLIIDKRCRVYQTWDDYLENNNLPPCLMVCPYQGKYQSLNNNFEVLLEEHFSKGQNQKKFNVLDMSINVGGLVLGGIAVFAGTAATRFSLLVAAIATTLSVISATRKLFGENGAGNEEETIDQGTRLLVYGLNATLLGINGLGMGSTILKMYRDNQQPTPLQILQLEAAIFFFSNTLYNFRSIGTVADESQAIALSKIEITLTCNRKRRILNKMLMEIMCLEAKAEVISAMRNMDNPYEVIRILNQNNRNLQNAGFQFSMQDGNMFLNEQQVDIMDISRMSTYDRSFLRSLVPVPDNLTPNVRDSINAEFNSFIQENRRMLPTTSTLATTDDITTFVREVLSAFLPLTRQFIYIMSQAFFQYLSQEGIVEDVARIFPDSDVFLLILRWICNTLDGIPAFEKISNEEQWSDGDIDSILEDLMRGFLTWFSDVTYDKCYREDRKAKRRENNREKERIMCTDCCGYFYT